MDASGQQSLSLEEYLDTVVRGEQGHYKLYGVTADIGGELKTSYFVHDGTVDFRHGGPEDVPPKFFLMDRSYCTLDSKVLVYSSVSGSGKTVELAGSSASRNAQLTVVVSFEEDIKLDEERNEHSNKYLYKEARNKLAAEALKEKMEFMVGLDGGSGPLKAVCESYPKDLKRIVVAIDEASSCPLLIRSVISDQGLAAKTVREMLGLKEEHCQVLFSVGGTGAATATIGSFPANFERLPTTGRVRMEDVADEMLGNGDLSLLFPGNTDKQPVTYKNLKKLLPVLATLVENGRMASVAARELRNLSDQCPHSEIVEGRLVDRIVYSFMLTNGLQRLVGNACMRRRVAACALAVLMFQWKKDNRGRTPSEDREYEDFMKRYECGVVFNVDMKITKLVERYGMLEPSSEAPEKDEDAYDLLKMPASQQLVALSMLGINLGDMLDATPYGFEVLSTHLIKCALSACSVLETPDITIRAALAKVGFGEDENATLIGYTKECWDAMDNWKIVPHEFEPMEQVSSAKKEMEMECHYQTRQMQVGLDYFVIEETKKDNTGGDGSSSKKAQKSITETQLLQIDKFLHDSLRRMKAEEEPDCAVPIAAINFGSSPLADGFVTFYCREKEQQPKDHFLVTIMNQAKDYHNGTKLKVDKLKEYAKVCKDAILNHHFGKDRLLCVAGHSDVVLAGGPCDLERPWLPFAVNKSAILEALLPALGKQRNSMERAKEHGVFVDKAGAKYDVDLG